MVLNRTNKIYIIITGLVAVTLIWLSQSNRNQTPELESFLKKSVENNAEQVNMLEGVLWSSDNETKGNLMLVNSYATIYIKTLRDFNSLVGKQVIASVDGTLENFTLLNIEENLTKDGYIKVR